MAAMTRLVAPLTDPALSGGAARRALYPPRFLLPGMRVGLFGGSFNPAHEGHRHVSLLALHRLDLDMVLWIVTPGNPLKNPETTAPLEARLAAARAVSAHPRIAVTGLESRWDVRYTVDTVRLLQKRWPKTHFVWIMGADNLAGFSKWKGWMRIASSLPIAVVDRPGYAFAPAHAQMAARLRSRRLPEHAAKLLATAEPPAWVVLHGRRHPLSATLLRSRGHWTAAAGARHE